MATTEWKVQTIGQNKTIQDIAAAAEKASSLVTTNVELASTAIKAAGVLLTGLLSPYILLLRATADAIDDFVVDFRDIGFYVLEVTDAEGGYIIPEDADGNPIKMLVSPLQITANMAIASTVGLGQCAVVKRNVHGEFIQDEVLLKKDGSEYKTAAECEAAGGKWDMTKGGHGISGEFVGWAKEFLGEEDILLTGPQKAAYEVEVGKAEPEGKRTGNANDNKLGTVDEITGMYKMTPSQVIATIIGAMDDELDDRRPNFSASAEAGAVIVLVGISDLTKNLANLKSIIDAFNVFFGGQGVKDKNGKTVPTTGVAGGMAKLGGLVSAALLQVENPDENNVTLKVNNVCKVRGTEEDKKKLGFANIPYMTEGVFEVNDFVVGPRVKFGARCQGYVAEVKSTEVGDAIITKGIAEGAYQTQELVITGLTNLDAIGWRSLSSGAKLQKVASTLKYNTFVDQNTGRAKTTGPFNDFEYLPNLPQKNEYSVTNDEGVTVSTTVTTAPDMAPTKVKRESGKTLLTVVATEDVREEHTFQNASLGMGSTTSSAKFTTNNVTVGDILEEKTPQAPHPNFKAVKLDDLIGDFKTFFSAIDALTDAIRKMADDAEAAIQDIIDYLDAKIAELEEIAAALQKILALFTVGLGDAGVYVLSIPVAIGGNDYIKAELQGAANRPPDTLDFTLAFMMMGGGAEGTEKGFKTLQKLLVP